MTIAEYLALVDVPECPIVHPSSLEIIEATRAVRGMLRVSSDVAMQKSDAKGGLRSPRKSKSEVLSYIPLRITDAMHERKLLSLPLGGNRADLVRPEDRDAGRPAPNRVPAVEGIVVAVNNEYLDGPAAKLFDPSQETELGADSPITAVINVAGQEE